MSGLVGAQLSLAEQENSPTPIQAVLVEPVVASGGRSGALIIGERIARSRLPENVDLIFGAPLKPTFKVLQG